MVIACPLCGTHDPKCVEIAQLLMVCACEECGARFTLHLNVQAITRSESITTRRAVAAAPSKPA